jgi:AraC-like DNA-binding protein
MFNSGILNTIVLLGSIQGMILACLLFYSKVNRQANRLLAWIVFLIALACLNIYWIHQDAYDSTVALRVLSALVPLIIVMPLGPLVYFYVKSNLDPAFKLTRKHRIFFYPVILDIVPQLTALIFIIGILTGIAHSNDNPSLGNFIDTYNVYADLPRWISLTLYCLLSLRMLAAARAGDVGLGKSAGASLKWLQQFIYVLLVFQSIWLLHLIPYLIPRYSNRLLDWGDWYPLYIPLVIIVYWLGIKGYLLARDPLVTDKKKGAPLPETAVTQAIALLKKAMEEDRLFLDPNLSLSALAEHTGLAPKTISAVLNGPLSKSFSEFINEYRITEIKERLLQSGSKNITIAGLAYECGFNSQPTFQRAFKSLNGVTPREFLLKNS